MGLLPSDIVAAVLTLPAAVIAVMVSAHLTGVLRRTRRTTADPRDRETAWVFAVCSWVWVLVQGIVTAGLVVVPAWLDPVLREGRDRLMFDLRSGLYVLISWLGVAGGVVMLRWVRRQLRGEADPHHHSEVPQ